MTHDIDVGWCAHLPRVSVPVHLGCNGVHDVLLALNALLPPLYLLYVFLPLVVTQLPIPLPERPAVCAHLQPNTHASWICPLKQKVQSCPLVWANVYRRWYTSVVSLVDSVRAGMSCDAQLCGQFCVSFACRDRSTMHSCAGFICVACSSHVYLNSLSYICTSSKALAKLELDNHHH